MKGKEIGIGKMNKWRAVDIHIVNWRNLIKEVGLWQVIWGTDIFVGGIPMIKLMVGANMLIWVLLWVGGR